MPWPVARSPSGLVPGTDRVMFSFRYSINQWVAAGKPGNRLALVRLRPIWRLTSVCELQVPGHRSNIRPVSRTAATGRLLGIAAALRVKRRPQCGFAGIRDNVNWPSGDRRSSALKSVENKTGLVADRDELAEVTFLGLSRQATPRTEPSG